MPIFSSQGAEFFLRSILLIFFFLDRESEFQESNDEIKSREKSAEKQDSGFDEEEESKEDEKKAESETEENSAENSAENETHLEKIEPQNKYSNLSDSELAKVSEELKEKFDTVSKSYETLISAKKTYKTELEDLERLINFDLESELGLSKLYKMCFEKQINEYKYNHCFLDNVEQNKVLLGKFTKFNRDEKSDILRLYYENGQRCWGADSRSVTIQLQCSIVNEIVSVKKCFIF